MKAASLSEIKKELKSIPQEVLVEMALRVAKYKKENKELLSYLLFESHNESSYIDSVKAEVESMYAEINDTNVYFVKKSVRKILRFVTKSIKYSGQKTTEVELMIHFCKCLRPYDLVLTRNLVLLNIYERQLVKIQKAISTLHEDLQFDYQREFEEL
jgi:hypothetical protein